MDTSDDMLPAELQEFSARAAVEGIPVAAIARVFKQPLEMIYISLEYQRSIGAIAEIPRADWPPTARRADHLPQLPIKASDTDMLFMAQKTFHLTKLEAGFLAVLLRVEHADKATLHGVIEQQRLQRQAQPDRIMELTDPKMVDVMICKLRKKMRTFDQPGNRAIGTIWGGGYYIKPEVKAAIIAAATGDRNDQKEGGPPAGGDIAAERKKAAGIGASV